MKTISNYPNYSITKNGYVWDKQQKCWLKQQTSNSCGHYVVRLDKAQLYVHRLVLETFVGLCPTGLECRHLDGNPQNNNLDNLKWGTRSENQKDAFKHGTRVEIGGRNRAAKLRALEVLEIRQLYKTGKFTHKILAERFGVSIANIGTIIRRKSWRHI